MLNAGKINGTKSSGIRPLPITKTSIKKGTYRGWHTASKVRTTPKSPRF